LQAELKVAGTNVAAFDNIALPAIRRLEADYCDGLLLEVKRDEALFKLREIVAEMGDARALPAGAKPTVLCLPATNLADEVTAEMLMEGLHVHGVQVECLSSRMTSGELASKAVELQPRIVCVSALCQASVTATAFICKHLRARLPEARVMVGLWQEEGEEFAKRVARLEATGAHRVLPTLERMLTAVLEQIPPEELKPGLAEEPPSDPAEADQAPAAA
jgi:methylmalonyl-CoA mutase cobalamin-binding subunit